MKKNLMMAVVAITLAPTAWADAFSGTTYIATTIGTVNNNTNVSPYGYYPYGYSPFYAPLGFYDSGVFFNAITKGSVNDVTSPPVANNSGTTSNASSTSYAVSGQLMQQQSQGDPYSSAQQNSNALTVSILNTVFKK